MTETLNYHSYQNILVVDEYKSIKENELPCNTQEDIQNADYIQNDLSNSASTLKCANSMNLNTNSSEPISFKNPIHVAPFFVAEKNGSDPKLTIREEVLRRNNLYGNNLYTFNSYMEERLIRWRPSLSQNNVDDTVNGKHIYFSMEDQTQNDQSDNGLINLCKRLSETYGIIDTISQPNQMTANVENEMQNENTIPPQEGSNSSEDKDADPGSVIHEDFACFDAQEISLQYEHGQSIKENIRKGKRKMSADAPHDISTSYLSANSISGEIIDAYPVEQKDVQCSKKKSNLQSQANQHIEADEPSICCGSFFSR